MLVKWMGIQGPFQVQQTGILGGSNTVWQNVGPAGYGSEITLPIQDGALSVVRVQGGSPNYVGAPTCKLCHKATHTTWTNTAHFGALKTLQAIGMGKNASCLPCHTVGYGLPNGYVDEATTPQLAGVQCENCHGPGGNHVENTDDLSVRPIVTISAAVCGGCHTDAHHPTYDEWLASNHSFVTPDVASGFASTNGVPNEGRMNQCGVCHSGAVRMALLNQLNSPSPVLPSAHDASTFAVTCTVCHNPHQQGVGDDPATQLRNPIYSLENFSLTTSTNATDFTAQYDPTIQTCGQCHNMRGAKWTDTSRPPHHSPQYNMLIGQGGYSPDSTIQPILTTHGVQEEQCVGCHVHAYDVQSPTPENPNYKGHTFLPDYEACVDCHGSAEGAQAFAEKTAERTKERISEVVGLLNSWATTKAPETLYTNWGALSWEYSTPGVLGDPTGKLKGPQGTNQTLIPDGIKQARMNLYLVQHDGSFGVHNGAYANYLINVAKTNVNVELVKP